MTMSSALAAETLIAGAFLAWAVSPLSSAPEPLSNGIEFLTELVLKGAETPIGPLDWHFS
jgi:hypothetical protein